jgi:hypothetical protein
VSSLPSTSIPMSDDSPKCTNQRPWTPFPPMCTRFNSPDQGSYCIYFPCTLQCSMYNGVLHHQPAQEIRNSFSFLSIFEFSFGTTGVWTQGPVLFLPLEPYSQPPTFFFMASNSLSFLGIATHWFSSSSL